MTKESTGRYTCNEYREEMTLLGLRKRLAQKDITEDERTLLTAEIDVLEAQMGLD